MKKTVLAAAISVTPLLAIGLSTSAHAGDFTPIVKTVRYTDSTGSNTVEFQETEKQYANHYQSKSLYAVRYVKTDFGNDQVWRIRDFIHDCPEETDLTVNFIQKGIKVTDLDKNGVKEVWVPYVMACRGDVSPMTFKLIMYEGTQKFAMRGTTRAQIDINEYIGGEYTMDAAFDNAPQVFTTFAKKHWKTYRNPANW